MCRRFRLPPSIGKPSIWPLPLHIFFLNRPLLTRFFLCSIFVQYCPNYKWNKHKNQLNENYCLTFRELQKMVPWFWLKKNWLLVGYRALLLLKSSITNEKQWLYPSFYRPVPPAQYGLTSLYKNGDGLTLCRNSFLVMCLGYRFFLKRVASFP